MHSVRPSAIPDRGGDPSFGLALGCGGARGLAHLHAIEAFDELGIRPAAIAGTSMGAILGVAMAAGYDGATLKALSLGRLGGQARMLGQLWRSRTKGTNRPRKFRIGQFDMEGVLRAFLPDDFPTDFAGLRIPARVVATDFYGDAEVVIGEGSLLDALAASACMPPVFLPVRRGGRHLVDGGMRNPVPFDLLEGKADFILAVDVTGSPAGGRDGGGPSAIEAMYGASQHMQRAITAAKKRPGVPDVLLAPQVGRYRALDFAKTAEIVESTKGLKDEVKRAVDAAQAAWRKAAA